jgi:hypothetical protein
LVLWIAASTLLFSSLILTFYIYAEVIGATFSQAIGGLIASQSLSHVITIASISALFVNTFTWHRTNKFKELPGLLKAFQAAMVESILAMIAIFIAVAVIIASPKPGLLLMIAIGLLMKGVSFLSAPYMAWLANRELAKAL